MNKKIFDWEKVDIVEIARAKSKEHEIPLNLILGVIETESNWNNQARRIEPLWKYFYQLDRFAKRHRVTLNTEKTDQSYSWGLMQLMGSVARELGHDGTFFELLIPELNIHYGCLKLKACLQKYGTEENAISAYNQGTPLRLPNGSYKNQDYVNRVLEAKAKYRLFI